MRDKPHSNKFKRLRQVARQMLPEPVVKYDVKNHRGTITIEGKRYAVIRQQLLLGICQRKVYKNLKRADRIRL